MLMGHNIGASGHYYRPNEFEIFQDYKAHAADALTIDPAPRLENKVKKLEIEQSEELRQVKYEIQTLKQPAKT
jgi:hypothetical protein